jgi:arogenate/prephenate dehydratase
VVKEAVDDTAGAAQMVAQQQLRGVAAVASRRAAELYGLEILDEGIQDFKDNVTRFIKLSRWAGESVCVWYVCHLCV